MEKLKNEIKDTFKNINSLNELNDLKVKYLGKKGIITELNSKIKDLPNEEKREYGKKVNEVRTLFNTLYDEEYKKIELENINKKLEAERIDITLPATKIRQGAPSILEKLIEEVETVCISMGYDVVRKSN